MNENNIQKAGGILLQDRKFMLEKHGGNDTYVVPGGKLEIGETPEQALVREFQEEFHLSLLPTNLEALGIFEAQAVHSPDKVVTIYTFLVTTWSGELQLDDGIEEVLWVNSKNIHNYAVSSIALANVLPLLLAKGLID